MRDYGQSVTGERSGVTRYGPGDKLPAADGALTGLVVGVIVAYVRERRRTLRVAHQRS